MSQAQEDFQKQVAAILEVVIFENWLRFYFIHDQQGDLRLNLPEKSIARIGELYPRLLPLAEKLNGKSIDFDTSRKAVLNHLLEYVDGQTMPRGQAQRILSSPTFQVRLQLFHTWAQMHEDQLDQGFLEFGAWRNLFAQWLDTPGATELAKKLLAGGRPAH